MANSTSSSASDFLDSAKHSVGADGLETNLSRAERYASLAGGVFLLLLGLKRPERADGIFSLVAGAALAHRGLSGHCFGYQVLGTNSAKADADEGAEKPALPMHVQKTVSINKSADELYRHWRDFARLPSFMEHLESVTVLDEKRSHWVAKAPLDRKVEWDAEITDDAPGQRIAWRSVGDDCDVPNRGEVVFTPLPAGRGTAVRVTLDYAPPGGKAAALVAKLFGEEPQQQVSGDLWRFKQLMEAGEVSRAY
ncbi:MAG: SRPBCC family protein [Verrucomicrobia bacterium]|nr:SRPBCC family protein [Verrucomicrobiota bacterium]MBV9659214.1 SRPBCC family protein [Verrucomicrobiota bacterium]